MFKYKNTNNTKFFLLALFSTINFHSLNSPLAATKGKITSNHNQLNFPLVVRSKHQDNVTTFNIVAQPINSRFAVTYAAANTTQPQLLKQQHHSLRDTASNSIQNNSKIKDNQPTKNNQSLKLLQIISLSFFLLLFVPFGIFYPFLLLYRKLLSVDQQKLIKLLKNNNLPSTKSSVAATATLKQPNQTSQATISKLQIACVASDNGIRQKFAIINSRVELQTEKKIVELMSQNLAVLLEQEDWTHASYASLTLPLEEIKTEFNVISCSEKNKFLNQELSLVSRKVSESVNNKSHFQAANSYVVFTLIICTTNPLPLFGKIYTKEQLIQDLTKLNKLQKDQVIKFELLWNPQDKNQYLSNAQLLMEYGEMIRLL